MKSIIDLDATIFTVQVVTVCTAIMQFQHLFRPALMKPKATRFDDCIECQCADRDADGIPDGCLAPRGTCIAPGKRSPWAC
jgi:hypothetical protein